MKRQMLIQISLACLALAAAFVSGCAAPGSGNAGVTASDERAKVSNVGFLTEPGKLKVQAANGGFLCWRQSGINWKSYDKVMIERIQVAFRPGTQNTVDPTDLKMLVDYFHADLVKALTGQVQLVNAPGPGVLRVRIALTNLVPTNTIASLAGTAAPYGFVAEIGSGAATGRPVGSTPYLGQTGMEAQFRDGATGNVIAECADTEIGLKYAADLNAGATGVAESWVSGYLDSFSQWTYAKNAFDKWSADFARRFAQLRAG